MAYPISNRISTPMVANIPHTNSGMNINFPPLFIFVFFQYFAKCLCREIPRAIHIAGISVAVILPPCNVASLVWCKIFAIVSAQVGGTFSVAISAKCVSF